METWRRLAYSMCAVLSIGAIAMCETPNPFDIINRHVDAIGGWDNIKSHQLIHTVSDIEIVGSGLKGSLETWSQLPGKSREVVDLKVFTQTTGDDGSQRWNLDQNGKVQVSTDSATIKERELLALMSQYKHFEPGAKFFIVTYDHLDSVDGRTCHVLRTANTINSFVFFHFYDTTSFHLLKIVTKKPDGEMHDTFRGFREYHGVQYPVNIEHLELPTEQKTSIIVREMEIGVPIDPMLFAVPADDVRDYHFPTGQPFVDVPFKFIELHIYVPVTVKGKTKLWILDSGAEVTVIDAVFAREIGLTLEGNIIGQGATHTVDVSFTTLPPFDLNGLQFDSQKVASIDFNTMFAPLLGFEVGGILGYDFLSRLVTKIDYAHELLTFYEPDSFHYNGGGVVLEAPIVKGNVQQLHMTIDDTYSGLWDIDLGAGGLEFMYPFADSCKLIGRKGIPRMSFGAGGGQVSTLSQFSKLNAEGFVLERPIVGIPTVKGKGSFAHGELTGNAGNDLFRHFTMFLDYKRENVILEKGANFGTKFAIDRSGLQVIYDEGQNLKVLLVVPASPGDKAGIVEGDVLTEVNSTSIEISGGLLGVREIFRGDIGTKVEIGFTHDGENRKATLALRDLFQ